MGDAGMSWFAARLRRLLPLAAVALAAGLAVGAWGAWRERPEERLRLGEQALAARDNAAAREHLTAYLAARPADTRARLLAARAARRLRKFGEATADLRQCRQGGDDPDAIDVEFALIGIERDGEEPGPALRERARAGDDLGLAALETLIQYDLDTYHLYRALDGLNFYLTHRPDDLPALMSRAFVWERLLNFSDAVVDYRRAIASHPDSEAARLKLGEALLVAGTPAEALEQFTWLAQRRPDHGPTRLGLARCKRRLSETDEARRLLDALATEFPNRGEVLWERGQLELDDGHPAESEGWLRRAMTASPHDRRIATSLSQCLLQLDRRAEAEAVRAKAEALGEELRRLDEARTKVLKQPTDAAAWSEGGLLFLRNGEREEGLRWLRRALQLDPANEAARRALGGADQ